MPWDFPRPLLRGCSNRNYSHPVASYSQRTNMTDHLKNCSASSDRSSAAALPTCFRVRQTDDETILWEVLTRTFRFPSFWRLKRYTLGDERFERTANTGRGRLL